MEHHVFLTQIGYFYNNGLRHMLLFDLPIFQKEVKDLRRKQGHLALEKSLKYFPTTGGELSPERLIMAEINIISFGKTQFHRIE